MDDWFQDAFSTCPHGLVKTYCHQCDSAAAEAKRSEKAREDARKLEATVKRQSAALDDAHAYIGLLRRRLGSR